MSLEANLTWQIKQLLKTTRGKNVTQLAEQALGQRVDASRQQKSQAIKAFIKNFAREFRRLQEVAAYLEISPWEVLAKEGIPEKNASYLYLRPEDMKVVAELIRARETMG